MNVSFPGKKELPYCINLLDKKQSNCSVPTTHMDELERGEEGSLYSNDGFGR